MDDIPDTRLSLLGRLHDHRNAEAWAEFVRVYQPLILSIIGRRGLQYADAMEVTQEVLGRVADAIADWNPDQSRGSFRGWLYRITERLTIDHLRRLQRQARDGNDGQLTDVPVVGADDSAEFRLEFERQLFRWAAEEVRPGFAEDNWRAFWMTTVEAKSIDDVAKTLAVSKGKVYVARSRVMTRIADLIARRLDETQT